MATIAAPAAPALTKATASHLKANTLNLFDATVIATSSVAPAYTLAATVAVTTFPEPILASANAALVAEQFTDSASPGCTPASAQLVIVADVVPSYTLLAAVTAAVTVF